MGSGAKAQSRFDPSGHAGKYSPARLHRQRLAALGAPAAQAIAALGGLHPLAEAMDLFALPLFGLIRLDQSFAPRFLG